MCIYGVYVYFDPGGSIEDPVLTGLLPTIVSPSPQILSS